MNRRVIKFGGSNLKSKEDIAKLIHAVKGYEKPPVIVISAFFGVTNYLYDGLNTVRTEAGHIKVMKDFLEQLKIESLESNIEDVTFRQKLFEQIKERIEQLEKFLLGVHYIGDIPDYMEDKILSYGERLSSLLLSGLLNYNGIKSEEKLPEYIGLITNGYAKNGTVDFSASGKLLKANLNEQMVQVIPGFYGVSPEGKINLLGRGGSDYSAAAIASCIDAESLDIWKDVNGYMSADPKIVKNAKRIEFLDYTEAAELSYFGARILHPRAVEPLEEKNIPLRLFNIEKVYTDRKPLSIISRKTENNAKSVTYDDTFGLLQLTGPGVGMKAGILARLTTLLDKGSINIKSVVTSQTNINIYLDRNDLIQAEKIIKEEDFPAIRTMKSFSEYSIVAVVGTRISQHPEVTEALLRALSKENIDYKIMSSGASDSAVYCVIKTSEREKAIQSVHSALFSQ